MKGKKNKLTRLLEPSMRLYFLTLVLFALLSIPFNWVLAVGEGVMVAALYFYFRQTNNRRKREILRYINNVTDDFDQATKDTMVNAPLPMVIFKPETDEVIWSNERFLALTGEREHLFDAKLSAAVPDFSSRWLMEGKSECPDEVHIGKRRFRVFGHLVRADDPRSRSFLATVYWVDVTELSNLRDRFFASRPVVAILLLDNYEEFLKGLTDNVSSALLSEINSRLDAWVSPAGGVFCRYSRDRYLFIFEERYLPQFQEGKFSILDSVHEVVNSRGMPATVSVGIGKGGDTFEELFQFANLSIDMALSRGGDQAVIKNKVNFEFFGGRSRELEKRTKVKSRVMATAFSELVSSASQVFIMGHSFPDLDCIGAAAGVMAVCRKRGVPAHIVQEPGSNPASGMVDRLSPLPEYAGAFLSPQDALIAADPGALLVVVDTNRPEQVASEDLLTACTKVAVIDHHRRAATYIAGAALNFHEPYASSASELVTELLQYVLEPSDLLRTEAEALLAGIVLDTKQFSLRTGGRTFEAAAFLRRAGADTSEVRKLFQNDLEGTIARYDIIRNARMYRSNVAIAQVKHTVPRVVAAQAADELLSISGIDASFVLFPNGDRVIVSARSIGEVNVQVVLERIGGGGNAAAAGAQVPGSLDAVTSQLIRAIDQFFAEE